jgi:hypothetical protein
MSTSLDIVNGALDIIGQSPIVSIENPTSKEEKICSRWYNKCRRYLLAYHPWDFAEGDYSCSRSGTPSDPDYTDKYRLPNDFLELVDIKGEGSSFQYSFEHGKIDWTRRGNEILLNADGASSITIVYTKDFTVVSQFSAKFTEALEEYLAGKIMYPVTKDAKGAAAQKEIAKDVINEAMSIDGQGKRIRRVEYSRAIAARRGGSIPANPYRIQ